MELPNQLPILSRGKQEPGSGKVCAEQAVNWLVSGRMNLDDETDRPECVQPVLNGLSIYVQDLLSDKNRHKMWPFILRHIGTARPELEPQLSTYLAQFAIEYAAKYIGYDAAAACAVTVAAKYTKYGIYTKHVETPPVLVKYVIKTAIGLAEYVAEWATLFAANNGSSEDEALLKVLKDFHDEYDRLTGHQPKSCDISRIERLGELVGVVEQ